MDFNLAAVADINRVVAMINDGNYDVTNEVLMDKMLLDKIKLDTSHYVHLANSQTKTLPKGTQKIKLRRWGGLTAHTTPLKEGIPPMPDKTSMESITFTATAFGRYMEFTDRIDLDQIDPVLLEYSKELGDVMTRTLERYARETYLSAASKLFANGRMSVGELQIGDVVTLDDLRFAALRMKRLLVKPIGANFNYITSPEALYDLIDDPLVEKYMQINQTTKRLYDDGEPFPMFTVKFIPTMLDEHYTPDLDHPGEYYDGTKYMLRLYAVTPAGQFVYRNLDGTSARAVASTVSYLADGTAIEGKVNWTIDSKVYADTDTIETNGGVLTVGTDISKAEADALAWAQLPVHKGILYGQDALIKVGMPGEGNTKTYHQGLGSGGVDDPIHQRQTIGAKINSIGFGLLREEAVVVTYSVPTQAIYVSGLTAGQYNLDKTTGAGTAADTDANVLDYQGYTVNPQDKTKGTLINK